jgi:hypothetical protein
VNALRTTRSSSSTSVRATTGQPAAPVRHVHRERDFGIGYGNSSGYGCEEHFAQPPWGPDRFRCL